MGRGTYRPRNIHLLRRNVLIRGITDLYKFSIACFGSQIRYSTIHIHRPHGMSHGNPLFYGLYMRLGICPVPSGKFRKNLVIFGLFLFLVKIIQHTPSFFNKICHQIKIAFSPRNLVKLIRCQLSFLMAGIAF